MKLVQSLKASVAKARERSEAISHEISKLQLEGQILDAVAKETIARQNQQ